MIFILIPFFVVAVIGLMCLNVKIGFIVSDWTEHTGFSAGFYMMTVFFLSAAEISFVSYLCS